MIRSGPFRIYLPAPPSLHAALLSALSAAHRRCGTMRALTPVAPRTQRDRPLRSIRWPSGHPIPNHVVRPNVTCLSPRASGRLLAEPGFAHTPRRLTTTRRRIGFVFLQPIHSPPAAPHLASERRDHPAPRTTQLLSATYAVISHDTDSHRTDQRTDVRTRGGFQTRPFLTVVRQRLTLRP